MGDGEEISFHSPNYPNKYPNRRKCAWKIVSSNPDATLRVSCYYDIQPSRNCRGDRLSWTDGLGQWRRLCGHGSKTFVTKTNKFRAFFKSNKRRNDIGFVCTVLSVSTDSSTSQSTNEPPATEEPPTTECKCGIANPTRIVGGMEVSPAHKYPWQVGLKNNYNDKYWCGGTIINNQYVMTAAHCFFNPYTGERESDEDLVVGVGDHDMTLTSDDVEGVTEMAEVQKVIIHPNYVFRTNDNDIALIKLSKPLDLSKHKELGAICLPKDDTKTYAGQNGIATGWGRLVYNGDQPNKLMEVNLPILDPSCWNYGITQNMMCAGTTKGGKDTCQGDSGGPLYVNEDNRYVQVGITSFGEGCGDPMKPGVYARVSKFLSWIKTNTADATDCQ